MFYKDSSGSIQCPAATSFDDGLLRYQQTGESAVQATTTETATTPMNSVQQQTLPSVNSTSQQHEQHPEQQQQNIQDSNDSVMILMVHLHCLTPIPIHCVQNQYKVASVLV